MKNKEVFAPDQETNEEAVEVGVEKTLGESFVEADKDSQQEHAKIQEALLKDGKVAGLETMEIKQQIKGKTEEQAAEKEAMSARIKAYSEAIFDEVIADLEDKSSHLNTKGGWLNPNNLFGVKKEIDEQIYAIQTMKNTALKRNFLPSLENIFTTAKHSRKNIVRSKIAEREAELLKPGDLENFKSGIKNLEKQIQPSQVKLSGE